MVKNIEQMYNSTKRITITNNKQIVIAGQKSWNPIGKYFLVDGLLVGKLRKVENPFETKLDESNSVDFKFNTISELRKFVQANYETELK